MCTHPCRRFCPQPCNLTPDLGSLSLVKSQSRHNQSSRSLWIPQIHPAALEGEVIPFISLVLLLLYPRVLRATTFLSVSALLLRWGIFKCLYFDSHTKHRISLLPCCWRIPDASKREGGGKGCAWGRVFVGSLLSVVSKKGGRGGLRACWRR